MLIVVVIQKIGRGGRSLSVQGQHHLQSTFQANYGYTVRDPGFFCLSFFKSTHLTQAFIGFKSLDNTEPQF